MRSSESDRESTLEDGPAHPIEDNACDADGPPSATAVSLPTGPGPGRTPLKVFTQDLIVTGAGAATSIATAFLLLLVEQTCQTSVYTWMVCFVFPVGALLAGFAAAGGYYLGAWYFGYRPTRQVLVHMVAISVGTFFLVHWLGFRSLEAEGRPLSEQVSFWSYLDFLFRHQSLRISEGGRTMTTDELGRWGYAFALLQIAGFALGGWLVFRWLAGLPYCEKCSRYFSVLGKQERITSDPHVFAVVLQQVAAAFDAGRLQDAIDRHTAFEGSKRKMVGRFWSVLTLRRCSGCGTRWLGFFARQRAANCWKEIKGARLSGVQQEPLRLPK